MGDYVIKRSFSSISDRELFETILLAVDHKYAENRFISEYVKELRIRYNRLKRISDGSDRKLKLITCEVKK